MKLTKNELQTISHALRDRSVSLSKQAREENLLDHPPIRKAIDETIELWQKIGEEIDHEETLTMIKMILKQAKSSDQAVWNIVNLLTRRRYDSVYCPIQIKNKNK